MIDGRTVPRREGSRALGPRSLASLARLDGVAAVSHTEADVVTITTNRPAALNAFTVETVDELIASFTKAGEDRSANTPVSVPGC